MRLQHKVPTAQLTPTSEPVSERYQAEIDRALRRAEKAWRQAERRRKRAEERAQREPSPANEQARELVRAEVERLWAEFERLDRLMRAAPVAAMHSGAGQVRHRTGRDDNLQLGVYKRPPRQRTRRPSRGYVAERGPRDDRQHRRVQGACPRRRALGHQAGR